MGFSGSDKNTTKQNHLRSINIFFAIIIIKIPCGYVLFLRIIKLTFAVEALLHFLCKSNISVKDTGIKAGVICEEQCFQTGVSEILWVLLSTSKGFTRN